MKTYEEIGKAISQGYLFIKDRKYYITEVKRIGGATIFIITNESGTLGAGVDAQSDNWTAELIMSAENRIWLETIAELDFF